ncbi:bifunctional DNA-formamidopyrimidine glycosylase/DNA-(apurinic or apyrimidinic site) lyase [Zymomonas sp.]|uniref:bifunctional DNA-formamidopyrimidine glycosylase/DNA-(apurinic or apyrimidinic site) lyase n=1 Tax=Zymomonas sp. TaxID=2068624 RepID=UPI0025EA459B|nr:bifunctional DNA-formamidopyrimidine glycosylase/DNA-(apurinic or apyrimidinic site) lyase [Zymomonas sp.]MCA1955319.1 bifunctional DNA-formamidopyrimidine glycosylase/DNA-(apurinic or apyrimidinic site) lyase [Zymomonas sp.]
MPELPEVETTVRGLSEVLMGEKIIDVKLYRTSLRRPIPSDIQERLVGSTIVSLSRRAKYGIIVNDRDDALIFHLGMSGRWKINPENFEKHDHFVLKTKNNRVVSLCDPRRFGSLDLVEKSQLSEWPYFKKLGAEPLTENFSPEYLQKKLFSSPTPIKKALLDQKIVAGVGNIYACEALYQAKIHPHRAGKNLTLTEITALVFAVKDILQKAIAEGGSTLKDYARPNGELGYFSTKFKVYGKEGEACKCGCTIERVSLGGRSTFFCSSCQK